jgi:hypothetical protein
VQGVSERAGFDGFRKMPLWQEAQALADAVAEVIVALPRRIDAEVVGRQAMRAAGRSPQT